MISIRLKRIWRKKTHFFHIVVAESKFSLKGKFIEKIGYCDFNNMKNIKMNKEKISEWISKGAIISERIKHIIKVYNNDIENKSNKNS